MILIRFSSKEPLHHKRILHSIRHSVLTSGYANRIKIGRITKSDQLKREPYHIGLVFDSSRYKNKETEKFYVGMLKTESSKPNIDAVFEINGTDGKVSVNLLYKNGEIVSTHNAILELPNVIKEMFE